MPEGAHAQTIRRLRTIAQRAQVSMMLITLPVFMPLLQRQSIDPLWFGILFLICMQLGLLTPPFCLLLFTVKGVAPPSIEMSDVYRAVPPFLFFGVAVLVAVFLMPSLATWLPDMLLRTP